MGVLLDIMKIRKFRFDMYRKKGMAIEALMRIIIAVILLFIAIKVGQKVASIFSGSDAPKSLETFTDDINNLGNGESKQSFIILDPNMAVIGFSKNAVEFRCNGCIQETAEFKDGVRPSNPNLDQYYSMKKPSYSECTNNACVCVCLSDFGVLPNSHGDSRELYCRKFYCRTINTDVSPKIYLQIPLQKKKIVLPAYPYWENGFMFSRRSSSNIPSNGMDTANTERSQVVCITKTKIADIYYSQAYPAPC